MENSENKKHFANINLKKILLVGNPNVGKSALFMALSGQYVEVSNYPGTTVELLQTTLKSGKILIDTPGVYSVSALNDEEQVTKEAIENLQAGDLVINVVNALSLQRDLFLTLHLIDLQIPFIVVINQIDEAIKQKIEINFDKLKALLGLPIYGVSALTGQGIEELKEVLNSNFQPSLGNTSIELMGLITPSTPLTGGTERLIGLFLHEEDPETLKKHPDVKIAKGSRNKIYAKRRERVNRLLEGITQTKPSENKIRKKIDALLIHPFYGTVFALFVSFFFLYQVLGVWVAGDLVNFLENQVFDKYWNSNVRFVVAQVFPSEITFKDPMSFSLESETLKSKENKITFPISMGLELLTCCDGTARESDQFATYDYLTSGKKAEYIFSPADLIDKPTEKTVLKQTLWSSLGTILAGKYGVLTLTITYLLGVLLPLVYFFYLSWALFEDTGYLPRLAVLADGFLRKIGLNGRGIIPLVLGLGCVTMAVVTTRLMSNKREQLILMILLGIAVPCSAQLGIIQGLLAKIGGLLGWAVWLIVLLMVLALCGFLANKLIPGISSPLLLDLPPLRIPKIKNLFIKANQKSWFFLKESGIAFFWASLTIAVFQVIGILNLIIAALKPAVSGILHLPKEVALSFLLGMVRRDFGAFGLLELNLSQIQAITACVTLTLFVPCIATLGVMIKERNWKTALGIWLFSWAFGFMVGGFLTRFLEFII